MKPSEHIGGILAVILSVCLLLLLFRLGFKTSENGQKRTINVASVEAKAVSGDTLQKRLADIANRKQAIEDARRAEIKRKEDLRKQVLARKKAAAEKAAAEKAAAEKAAAEKAAAEKAAAEKAAAEKAAAEKAAAEKAAAEKAAAEKAAAEKAAAEKAAAEKAAAEKAAADKAKKLQSIQPVDDLSALASYSEADALHDFGGKIQNKMKGYWQLPPNIPDNLSAKILIKIDNKGNVISANISQSSGYPLFDAAALETVNKTSPLPLPKNTKALQLVLKEGLEINFSP